MASDSSPVESHLRWGCKVTFNWAGKPENDRSGAQNDPPSLKLRRGRHFRPENDKSPQPGSTLTKVNKLEIKDLGDRITTKLIKPAAYPFLHKVLHLKFRIYVKTQQRIPVPFVPQRLR